jgi:hypothetical protein
VATEPPVQALAVRAPQYVYGVARASSTPALPAAGVCDAPVAPIAARGLVALASPPESARVRVRRRDLTRHADVLAAAFAAGTVVPLRFGAVFEHADAVASDLLEPRHDAFESLLFRLDGLAELRITAFYRDSAVLSEIVERDRRISLLRDSTRGRPAAATYALRLELGEVVAGRLAAVARADADRVLAALRLHACEVSVEERLAEMQVLRASFLVERRRVGRFDDALDALARRERDRMQFKLVGPLPPHSFVPAEAWAS